MDEYSEIRDLEDKLTDLQEEVNRKGTSLKRKYFKGEIPDAKVPICDGGCIAVSPLPPCAGCCIKKSPAS